MAQIDHREKEYLIMHHELRHYPQPSVKSTAIHSPVLGERFNWITL